MLTPEDWRLVVETALDNIDRDTDPKALHEWFVDLGRAIQEVAYDVVGLEDGPDNLDPLDAWTEAQHAGEEDE